MGILLKADYLFYPLETVANLIEAWDLPEFSTEKEYVSDLYDFLHEELDWLQVTKEFSYGRATADIVIERKMLIEAKLNLESKKECDRLIGQLEEYNDWKMDVIVLLIGETEEHLRKRIQNLLKKSVGLKIWKQWGIVCKD